MNDEPYRFEYKYVISAQSAELLKHTLRALLTKDEHADEDGNYLIRSVYFDDDRLSAYHDKLAGVCDRNKYRLRFYNFNAERIAFEAKRKHGQLVKKQSCVVSRDLAQRMLSGGSLTPQERQEPLLAEFDTLSACANLQPSVVVDYLRTAFTYPVNRVRITLDQDVCSDQYRADRVFERCASIPVMDHGDVILEVKYSEWLPPFLAQALSNTPSILQANSKYCSCLSVYL
jgi:SPX domain-containing protein involved in vacuolar polyphosphate accumulation